MLKKHRTISLHLIHQNLFINTLQYVLSKCNYSVFCNVQEPVEGKQSAQTQVSSFHIFVKFLTNFKVLCMSRMKHPRANTKGSLQGVSGAGIGNYNCILGFVYITFMEGYGCQLSLGGRAVHNSVMKYPSTLPGSQANTRIFGRHVFFEFFWIFLNFFDFFWIFFWIFWFFDFLIFSIFLPLPYHSAVSQIPRWKRMQFYFELQLKAQI